MNEGIGKQNRRMAKQTGKNEADLVFSSLCCWCLFAVWSIKTHLMYVRFLMSDCACARIRTTKTTDTPQHTQNDLFSSRNKMVQNYYKNFGKQQVNFPVQMFPPSTMTNGKCFCLEKKLGLKIFYIWSSG